MGKLTDQQRADIYQAWKDGTEQKDLAKQYGVCYQTINQLINKMNAKKPEPAELEDVENGIPNTPLVPAEIEKEISAIAEEKSENAEPEKIPDFVLDAVESELLFVERRIEDHVQQFTVQPELQKLAAKRNKLSDWLDAHTLIDIKNARTVTLKLPRWMVGRVFAMLYEMQTNYLRPAWNEKALDCIKEQLAAHDRKWEEKAE